MLTINAIIEKISDLTHIQRRFLIELFSILLTFDGSATWANLSRYSCFSERTMRRHALHGLDFASFKMKCLLKKSFVFTRLGFNMWLYLELQNSTPVWEIINTRDQKSLNFHANAALTAVNFARLAADSKQPFSIYSQKRENLNQLIAKNIFQHFKINPEILINDEFRKNILKIGCIYS